MDDNKKTHNAFIGPKRELSTINEYSTDRNPFSQTEFENEQELLHAKTPPSNLDEFFSSKETKIEQSPIERKETPYENREVFTKKFYKVNTKFFKVDSGFSDFNDSREKPFISKKTYDMRRYNTKQIFEYEPEISSVEDLSARAAKEKIFSNFSLQDPLKFKNFQLNKREHGSSSSIKDKEENLEFISESSFDEKSFKAGPRPNYKQSFSDSYDEEDSHHLGSNKRLEHFEEHPTTQTTLDFSHIIELNRMKSLKLINSIKRKEKMKDKKSSNF